MPVLGAEDIRRADALVGDLATLRVEDPSAIPALLPRVRELLQADVSAAYSLLPHGSAVSLEYFRADGFSGQTYARDFDTMLKAKPVGWGAYNPLCPEPAQRNVVKTVSQEVPARLYDHVPDAAALIENHRFLLDSQQLRVLVCEGPVMLAWVGVMRRGRFGVKEHALFKRLVPALHRRLSLERSIQMAPVAFAAFEALLENATAPAFLVRSPDLIVCANAGGRQRVGHDYHGLRTALHDAIHRGCSERFSVTRLETGPGVPVHWLVLERAPRADPGPRAARLAHQRGLTQRQTEVLTHLAVGKANKTIAALLGCAEVTVELHVTAILEKLGCESRAEAVARFWMT